MTSSVEVKSAEEEHGSRGTLEQELVTLTAREDSRPTSLHSTQSKLIYGLNLAHCGIIYEK